MNPFAANSSRAPPQLPVRYFWSNKPGSGIGSSRSAATADDNEIGAPSINAATTGTTHLIDFKSFPLTKIQTNVFWIPNFALYCQQPIQLRDAVECRLPTVALKPHVLPARHSICAPPDRTPCRAPRNACKRKRRKRPPDKVDEERARAVFFS